MKLFSWYKRIVPILLVIVVCLPCLPVAAEPATPPKKIEIVTNPDSVPTSVYYYEGKEKAKPQNFNWVTGRNGGQALALNGKSQYLRLATAQARELSSFTLSTWILWDGDKEVGTADAQKFLTFYRNEHYYLSVSPHVKNTNLGVDGLYMEWVDPTIDPIKIFHPTDGTNSFVFPAKEWHHVAITASGSTFTLYIDGVVYLKQEMAVDFDALDLRTFKIGAGFGNEPYLRATLQDTLLYTAALDDNQVALLAQDKDPLSGETASSTTQALATRPNSTTTTDNTLADNDFGLPNTILGLPTGLVLLLGGLLLVVVLLSAILSILGTHSREED